MLPHLDIVSTGMVTAVGLDGPSACAAMRARLDGFQETRFIGTGGEWLVGAPVSLQHNLVGDERLARMAANAINEAFDRVPEARGNSVLILCCSEPDRPGQPVPDSSALLRRIAEYVDVTPSGHSRVVAHGRPSVHVALEQAKRLIRSEQAPYVMIVGVDSYLTAPTIMHYLGSRRLLTADNGNGFIPGEGAGAILCAPSTRSHTLGAMRLMGLGLAREPAYIYNPEDLALRGDGMMSAYRDALEQAQVTIARVGYRIADLIGEQYWFKQSALAAQRLVREVREFQDLWSPGESLGNTGAAVGALMVAMAWTANQKSYADGNSVLIEASNDKGACAAAVFGAPEM